MTRLIASFDFVNKEFDITEQSKNGIYLKIYRELVCLTSLNPKYRMPVGGNGGLSTKLQVLYHGKMRHDLVWDLSSGKQMMDSGYTHDPLINIPIDAEESTIYNLNIYQPNSTTINLIRYSKNIHRQTQHKLIISQIRNNIIDGLPKMICDIPNTIRYGSEHMDNSIYNEYYKQSIRVEIPNKALYHIYLYYDDGYNMNILTSHGPMRPAESVIMHLGNRKINMKQILLMLATHFKQEDTYLKTLRSSPVASL